MNPCFGQHDYYGVSDVNLQPNLGAVRKREHRCKRQTE